MSPEDQQRVERLLQRDEAAFETLVYFVLDSEIRATRDGEEAWVAARGETIGALPVLDQQPAPVSAIAVGAARVLFVDEEVFTPT